MANSDDIRFEQQEDLNNVKLELRELKVVVVGIDGTNGLRSIVKELSTRLDEALAEYNSRWYQRSDDCSIAKDLESFKSSYEEEKKEMTAASMKKSEIRLILVGNLLLAVATIAAAFVPLFRGHP